MCPHEDGQASTVPRRLLDVRVAPQTVHRRSKEFRGYRIRTGRQTQAPSPIYWHGRLILNMVEANKLEANRPDASRSGCRLEDSGVEASRPRCRWEAGGLEAGG